jgi:CrcB protein
MKALLVVGAGGFFGAIARHLVNLGVARVWMQPFPLATFLVNVTGSFVLAGFTTWASARMGADAALRLFVGTGFVGAYTTFSTFEVETRKLADTGHVALALLNVLASVCVGYAAVALGLRFAR